MLFQNILHIDDDVENHEMFYEALQDVGDALKYNALTDAAEALEGLIAKKLTPDVIFLDLNMPRMNGQQFLMEVKKSEGIKHIPVFILSSCRQLSTIELMKDLGAKDFFTKPFSHREFVTLLFSVLKP
jgi:CheY-like chemotaxis protein